VEIMTLIILRPIFFLVMGICLSGLIYQILPIIACQLNMRLAATVRFRRVEIQRGWQRLIPRQLQTYLKKRLIKAGFRENSHFNRYVLMIVLPSPLFGIIALFTHGSIPRNLLAGLLVSIVYNSWISGKITRRRQAFNLSLYKLYRFLDLQLSAGIKATDVLKGLADAVAESTIQPDFQRFCASFELTLDLDQALQELETSFAGADMTLLSSQLRQCMQTGIIGRTFLRMEEQMFSRHLSLIQARTKHYKTWLLLTSLLALVPIMILFVYPLVAQAAQSMRTIFGP
jgi:hypothetical protein